jgi:hypothetical protein
MWLLLRNIYDGLILKVKWGDQTTESIDIKQGIRQGEKLSTLLYKMYNNTILDSITKSTLGTTIGNITVSAPACADDIALLGESKDIQAMLNLLEYNTKRDLVKLNPKKKEIVNVSNALQTHPKKYILGAQALVSFKKYMFPPLPYFKVNICPFPLPHFASIFFAYL